MRPSFLLPFQEGGSIGVAGVDKLGIISIHVKIAIYETNKPALLCCDMKLYIGDHVESI